MRFASLERGLRMARSRGLLAALACVLFVTVAPAPAQQSIPVDLQLVLAVDSSGSIDAGEFRLQMDGFAAAFRNPAILEAIRGGRFGRMAGTLVKGWSLNMQRQSIRWTAISDEESIG